MTPDPTPKPATFRQDLEWIAGPAQGNWPEIYDGERYLCAVQLRGGQWDMSIVRVVVDDSAEPGEANSSLEVENEPWGWELCNVVWYVPAKFLCPPMLPAQEKST